MRQQSSLAVQAGSKAQRSMFHQWQLQKQTKNGLIIFLCFGDCQRPLIVFILNYTGLWLTKHSFKIPNRQRAPKKMQKVAASCHTFCSINSGIISESSLGSPTQDCSSRIHVCKCPRKKIPGHRIMVKGIKPAKASFESTRLSCESGRTLVISWDSSKLNNGAGFCIATPIRHHFCKLP